MFKKNEGFTELLLPGTGKVRPIPVLKLKITCCVKVVPDPVIAVY